MVMELMDCDLYGLIEQNKLPYHTVLSILHDVSCGVWYLHSRSPPIVHCDLTPHNVLLNASLVAKIYYGFGEIQTQKDLEEHLDRMYENEMRRVCTDFKSLYEEPLYDLPMDVFSYGGVALYTVVKEWPEPSPLTVLVPETKKRIALSEVEQRQKYLDKMIGKAEVLRPLVEECLADYPTKRPTMEMVSMRIKQLKERHMERHPETKSQILQLKQGKLQQFQGEQNDRITQQRVQQLQQKDEEIQLKHQQLQQQGQQLQQKDQQLQQKDLELQELQQHLTEQGQWLRQQDQQLQQKDHQVQQKDHQVQQQYMQLRQQEQEIRQRDEQIQQLSQHGDKSTWVVSRNEIRLSGRELGTGGWGSVGEGVFRGCKVAVKSMDNEIISPYNLRLFSREMDMAARCRHPNLMQFIAATNEGIPLIITELMHTSLRKILQQGQLYSNQINSILLDVAYGLNYLHKTTPIPILHRDISSANVLLNPLPNNQWHAKLSDFGSANFMRASCTLGAGNPSYAAPEALKPEGPHTTAMDVFSFGVLMFEMCSRQFPHEKPNPLMLNNVKWGVTEGRLVTTIRSCLSHDIQGRPSMDYLILSLD